jgi:NAD(P)-dependent dehydrogenase (short-subunit alcohol dehydrogenase family)
MPLEEYKAGQAVDPSSPTDTSVLEGKSVIITGGASGLGLAYVKAFASKGAFVTFGDLNASAGETIASERDFLVRPSLDVQGRCNSISSKVV